MQTQWSGVDPKTGEKRIYMAELFAKKWSFKSKAGRRTEWEPVARPTRAMWLEVLDFVQRAYPRSQASPEQLRDVQRIVKALPEDYDEL